MKKKVALLILVLIDLGLGTLGIKKFTSPQEVHSVKEDISVKDHSVKENISIKKDHSEKEVHSIKEAHSLKIKEPKKSYRG